MSYVETGNSRMDGIIAMALGPGTFGGERDNAASVLRTMAARKYGVLIDKMIDINQPDQERNAAAANLVSLLSDGRASPGLTPAKMSQNAAQAVCALEQKLRESKRLCRQQERELADSAAENQRLASEIEILKAKLRAQVHLTTPEADPPNGWAGGLSNSKGSNPGRDDIPEVLPYAEFVTAVESELGTRQWKGSVAFYLGITSFRLASWKAVGFVPADYLARVRAMPLDDRQPASRQRWTNDDRERLKKLLNSGLSNLDVAKRLTCEFGRKLHEGSIVSQRRRLKNNEGWRPDKMPRRASSPP